MRTIKYAIDIASKGDGGVNRAIALMGGALAASALHSMVCRCRFKCLYMVLFYNVNWSIYVFNMLVGIYMRLNKGS